MFVSVCENPDDKIDCSCEELMESFIVFCCCNFSWCALSRFFQDATLNHVAKPLTFCQVIYWALSVWPTSRAGGDPFVFSFAWRQ